MMRRSVAGMVGAAAVAAVMATGFVHAQAQDGAGVTGPQHERRGPGGPGGFGRGGFGGPIGMLRQLDLSDDQRAQVRQVMESHRDELRAVGERVRAAHRAQREAVTATQFDEQLVRTRAAELAAAEADAAVLHAKVHSQVFAVLTPEQQAKAAELKAQREARAQQRMQQRQERIKQRQQRRATPPAQQ